MKTTLPFLLLFFTICSFSQTKVASLDSIVKYEGKEITVCNTVTTTHQSKGGKKVTYLNMGKPYPLHGFTVVIFEGDLKNFGYSPAVYLKNKMVCITGKVILYKGKPEIIVKQPGQIVVY